MYEMKPEYYIGIEMIDEEHKQLFQYADEAYELLHDEFTPDKYDKMNTILQNLRDYTVKHLLTKNSIWNLSIIRNYLHKKPSIRNLYIRLMNLWNITMMR